MTDPTTTRPEHWHLCPAAIEGDRVPGLLEGWCGPALLDQYGSWVPAMMDWRGKPLWQPTFQEQDPEHLYLDARRREARLRIVDRLGEGTPCPACQGGGRIATGHGPADCPDHPPGTGHLTPPHDARWQLDWPGGSITPEMSAELIACSLARVRAGMGPVRSMFSHEPAHSAGDNMATVAAGFAILHYDGTLICPWPEERDNG